MGAGGRDVQLSERAINCFPYAVECKSRAAIAIYGDFAQAKAHVGSEKEHPLLVIRQNHSEPLAVISLQHFMELVNASTNRM